MTQPAAMGFWQRRAVDGIRGAAEAFFPENQLGAPNWHEAKVVERTQVYLAELPPAQRRLLTLLFVFVELAAPLLAPGWGRFSRLSVARRTRAVRRWRVSRIYLLRLIGDALKATMSMMYLSHPAVLKHIEAYTVCHNPHDPLALAHRPRVHLDETSVDSPSPRSV
jgi:hypothetical protein